MSKTKYSLKGNPYIQKVLDISTGHITKSDSLLLSDASRGESENPIVTYKYDYGFLVAVQDERGVYSQAKKYGFSNQFIKIMRMALKLKLSFVKFDGDAIAYDDLKFFDW
jgi:hypothetical protein